MGDVINLNQYRKRRERDSKARKARENQAKTGRTGDDKAAQRREAEKSGKALEAKRLTPAAEGKSDADSVEKHDPPEDGTPSAG